MAIVLLVEDDPEIRELIAMALTDRGLDLRDAADDRAAQRILDREAGQVGVLIADVHLGASATGFDVARKARRLNPRLEVVYITGQCQNFDPLGVEGGVLFRKPFSIIALAEMVEQLMA